MTLNPPKALKALGLPIICAAMFVVLGGHWALLQGVAWTQMAWQYSQETGSLTVGMKKTFSGEFPCNMCKKIAAEKKKEQAPLAFKLDKKADVFFLETFDGLSAPLAFDEVVWDSMSLTCKVRSNAPPTPVPILLT